MKITQIIVVLIFSLCLYNIHAQTWSASEQSHFGIDGFGTVNHAMLTTQELETAYVWEAAHLKSANICWNRTLSPSGGQFKWEDIENTKGTYNWTKTDAFVKTIQQYNINLLVLIHPFVHWDQPSKNDIGYDKPNDMTAFKKFMAKLVERYDNDGTDDMPGLLYPIKYYEIGNEPEGPTFGDSPGTYNDFMTTVKAARDTAKTVYQDVKIVIGGAAPIYDQQGTASTNIDSFWKGVLNRANINDYFDIFNFHYFVGQYTADISDYVTYWKQLLSTYGLSTKETWLTETGSYSGTTTFYDGSTWPYQSKEYQASWLIKHSTYSLANGISKLFNMYYYSNQADWANAVAFVEINKTTNKAIYYAHQLIAEKIDAYSSALQNAYASSGQNKTSGNFKFTVNNKPVFILWNDQGGNATLTGLTTSKIKITKTVPALDGNGDVILDGSGNPSFQSSEADVTGGQTTITLTSVPVYVEEIATAPSVPAPVSPSNSQNNVPVALNLIWNKVNNADSYHLQVAGDADFNNIVLRDSTIADTLKQVTLDTNGKKYYWKIRAKNSAGISGWSDIWNFITILPSPTQLTAVQNTSTGITLNWLDTSAGEAGFIIERKQDNNNYIVIDTSGSNSTTYSDGALAAGSTYSYKVKVYTVDCESGYSNEAAVLLTGIKEDKLPTEFRLYQNYPNPFNPATIINYSIPSAETQNFASQRVTLKVYDLLGREIATLVDEVKRPGKYQIRFDASNLSSGIYYYQLIGNEKIFTNKMVLTK